MADSESRLSLVAPPSQDTDLSTEAVESKSGLADVVTLQRRREARMSAEDEGGFFTDALAEYQWARDAAGLSARSVELATRPIIEICDYYGTVPWRLSSREVDRYFAGPGKRAVRTVRAKLGHIDSFYAFLEQRYAGEIARRFGAAVDSPVDQFNKPVHRGDFGLRVPPSQRAMAEFFSTWRADLPNSRKYAVASRDYVMAKIAYLSGVRAAELVGVRIGDVHWEHGQWGRFVVQGKGARGSGPRQREAYLFEEGRTLLWWYIEEVRGEFGDDAGHPHAPLWPSERLPQSVAALNLPIAPVIVPATFRRALHTAAARYLNGPVTDLFPHLLRHACATHNYERGMSLWEVQKLLGHEWATTTLRYMATARADPEYANLEASDRAAQRLMMDKGNLR
ncbi:tyrosine-type recombinase/integrase [Rhodococcus sp. NPDC054953]